MEWISVKDRLPEDYEKVIAYCNKTNKYFVGFARKSSYSGDTYWLLVGASGAVYYVKSKVTHWMPLPEPPKEE